MLPIAHDSSNFRSAKASRMPPNSLAVCREGRVFLALERPPCSEDAEVFVQFFPRLRGTDRDGNGGMLEDELVPRRRAGNRESGCVVRRRTQKSSPAQRRVSDDRQPKRLGDWKYVPLGTTMCGVVADHDRVEESALGHLRGEGPLVARNPDPANDPLALCVAEVLECAAGRDDLSPLGCAFNIVQGENVDVVSSKVCQGRAQLRRGIGCGPSAELSADDNRPAAGAKGGDRGSECIAVRWPFGQALPVEKIDATIDGRKDIVGSEGGAAVGRQTKATDRRAEGVRNQKWMESHVDRSYTRCCHLIPSKPTVQWVASVRR